MTKETFEQMPFTRGGVNAYAVDPERAAALWTRSEELVGESFPS
jgi:hypothetical protein